MNLPSCNQLAVHPDFYGDNTDARKFEECSLCNGTGREVKTCPCGEDENKSGYVLCKACGRILEYVPCEDCKGEGKKEIFN